MTINEYILIIRRHWRLLVAGLAVGLLVAGGATYLRPAEYSAEVTVFVSALPDTTGIGSHLDGNDVAESRLTTYSELVTSRALAVGVAHDLGDPQLSPDDVADRIFVIPSPDTMLVIARATDTRPQRAAEIANLAADRLVAAITDLEATPDGRIPLIRAQVFGYAEPPSSPSSPRPLFNVLVGVVLGLVLGFAGGLAMEQRTNNAENRIGNGGHPRTAGSRAG